MQLLRRLPTPNEIRKAIMDNIKGEFEFNEFHRATVPNTGLNATVPENHGPWHTDRGAAVEDGGKLITAHGQTTVVYIASRVMTVDEAERANAKLARSIEIGFVATEPVGRELDLTTKTRSNHR